MRTRAATLKVWAALLAVMAAAMVIALAQGSEPAHAAFPGSTGDIAFTLEGNDPPNIIPQIYRMGADGYDPKRLSDTTGENSDPAWSSDGTNQKNLTKNSADDYEPVFSPDGRKIAFTSNRVDLKQVWRMRADGTNPVQLTFAAGPAGIKGFLPAWQPIS